MTKRRTPLGVELVDLAPEDEEHQDEEPWPQWEAPAVQAPIFAASIEKAPSVTVATDSSAIIRAWGRQKGYEVKSTGRIPDDVLKAYAKAHGGTLVSP
jgi:hypothetical protein